MAGESTPEGTEASPSSMFPASQSSQLLFLIASRSSLLLASSSFIGAELSAWVIENGGIVNGGEKRLSVLLACGIIDTYTTDMIYMN